MKSYKYNKIPNNLGYNWSSASANILIIANQTNLNMCKHYHSNVYTKKIQFPMLMQ